MPLTDTECRKAQPKDKRYCLSDSHSLSLVVATVGNKYWNVLYTVHGERKSESIDPISRYDSKESERVVAIQMERI